MVQIDWVRIRAVKASSLTDDEIEDLFPMVIKCDTEEVDDILDLRAVMKLSQEILQYKDNQVESLLLECDELKEKLATASTSSKSVRRPQEADAIEEANSDQKAQDSSLAEYYEETLHAKNDKLKTLLLELEGIEKENIDLKQKLETLKEEMEDATESMNEMTDELDDLRSQNVAYKDEVKRLKQEKKALLTQIEEITSQQVDRDKIIDEFGAAIDIRVSEWKDILDNKDAIITQLKEQVSHSRSSAGGREHQTSQIVYLNEEIEKRDTVISELEAKLLEAARELNESAAVMEELKRSNKKLEKSGKRKEHRDLLRKAQEAHEKISMLQEALRGAEENLMQKSEQLCELLDTLRRYEDKDRGLTEALEEIRDLKRQLEAKNQHIQDLVTVINKLENLSSHQEMQIAAMRQKLGLPDDEEISIEGVTLRHQQEVEIKNQLVQKNSALEQENVDLKADIRTLKYRLNKLGEKIIMSRDASDSRRKSLRSDPSTNVNWVAEQEIVTLKHKAEMDGLQENIRMVVEENEALRKGLHEILDSIHDQDGKGTVDVQSDTLERLLEALDVRHLAGWYHPAMRLQERLNVVQGSNAELRTQIKHLRKETQKKDELLRRIATRRETKSDKSSSEVSESDNEDVKTIMSDMQRLQSAYREELEHWEQERESLRKENAELKEANEKMTAQLEIFEADLKAIESGDEEIQKAFVARTRESSQSAVNLIIISRKCSAAESLLSKESAKLFQVKKEAVAAESTYRKIVADVDKRSKLLENKIKTLESNLSNSVSKAEYNDLKEKYDEVNMRLRTSYELQLGGNTDEDSKESTDRSDSAIHSPGSKPKEDNIRNLLTINSELRDQLIHVQNSLSQYLQAPPAKDEENKITELQGEIGVLKIENENLLRTLAISREEAQMHYTVNSLKTLELDNLRHQILDLQAISEDKETIARLGFELNNSKAMEIEMSKRKAQLESEISQLRSDLEVAIGKRDEAKARLEEFRRHCSSKCKVYNEIINFLQTQYSGSTSITSLHRYEDMLQKLNKIREEISTKFKEAKDQNDAVKIHQEALTKRLALVDQLKDILEQQIGTPELQSVMRNFSEHSQSTLNEYRYKRQIAQLETELQMTISKLVEYESTISEMEYEIVNMQKVWKPKSEAAVESVSPVHIAGPPAVEKKSVFTEARVESNSVETQSDPLAEPQGIPQIPRAPEVQTIERIISSRRESADATDNRVSFLQDQLKQALTLASDRSAKLIEYESQITEYKAKLGALDKALIDKDSEIVEKNKLINQKSSDSGDVEEASKVALKSTINSLQQIITQKDETITRYQTLLKEDRDEHSKAAARLQEEIKDLRTEISYLKDEGEKKREKSIHEVPERDSYRPKIPEEAKKESQPDVEVEEKIARLEEQVSTLEADLHIVRELSDRWRRLAEERLQHMDDVRERLEAQHKNELESYRAELDKWQSETSALRQQLSENRMKLAKGNISLSKELQERDGKIEELTVAYQQLQNDFDVMEQMNQSQPMSVHSSAANKIQEGLQGREASNHLQTELEHLRRQHKSVMEKERLYRDQIVDLKQQLSRRYMAEKSEERRASQRELQLERKLKSMEEELNKARLQLDHEYRAQEAKRVKTAEELSLWEKQKKWQQTAERLKKELKEKSEEYRKLTSSYDKLRAVVSCMEREKWYLRSKLRSESGNGGFSVRSDFNFKVVEDLQIECQTLRDRINELTNRLESEDTHELLLQVEKQKRRIAALEVVAEGNSHTVDQLEKLETAKATLEKANIRLESENFELRMGLEKLHVDTPRLREKVEHLEKYVELLKVEKSSDSSDRSSEKEQEHASKKSVLELEKTIFVLKRIVEKLQAENKRLRANSKNHHRLTKFNSSSATKVGVGENNSTLKRQYEQAKKRVVALETDLQLAEQRILMLEKARSDEENCGEIGILKHQLAHKSELLDKVKQLLTRAAVNEKALRQKIHQIEMKQTLATIPECQSSPSRST
ncbi:centrosomal protein cep290 [Diachasma alloeum]|uniref:centrosomal protein cep290 n=1 Tax=Diachasma alloeum TaxID=454923 RepID=UPI0007382886|nr:centrosomal protein cep290 [Diachasma alloeum]